MMASRARQRIGTFLAVLVLLALTMVIVPAAHADDPALEFSTDGVSWAAVPPSALFGHDVVLVPGGSVVATLHLRSIAPTPGVLDASLTNVDISGEEAGRAFGIGTITGAGIGVGGAGVGLPRTMFEDLSAATPVGPPIMLVPGQSARFILTIDLDPVPHGSTAQATAISLDLSIAFRDAAVAEAGDADDASGAPQPPALVIPVVAPDDGQVSSTAYTAPGAPLPEAGRSFAVERSLLAVTGFTRTVFMVVAAGLIVSGLLLLLISRRKDRT